MDDDDDREPIQIFGFAIVIAILVAVFGWSVTAFWLLSEAIK